MGHVKKNLRTAEDQAAKYGLANRQEARFARVDLSAKQTCINYLVIKPNLFLGGLE